MVAVYGSCRVPELEKREGRERARLGGKSREKEIETEGGQLGARVLPVLRTGVMPIWLHAASSCVSVQSVYTDQQ